MVRIFAAQVVNLHGDQGVIDQTLEKFMGQVNVKSADHGALEFDVEHQAGATGEIDHHARQRLVERHIGVPIATQSLLVAQRPDQRLPDADADVLDRVVRVNVQIPLRLDLKIDHPVTSYLIEHVIKKRNAAGKFALTATVKIKTNLDPGFEGVSGNFGLPHVDPVAKRQKSN